MGLARILMVFALLLLISTATAFLGYRYIGLASEYRSRNFDHLREIQRSISIANGSAIVHAEDAKRLRSSILRARSQANWCLENLNNVEVMAFKSMGAGKALEVCAADIATADRALALIARIEDPQTMLRRGPGSAFSLRLALIDELEQMRSESLQFHPYTQMIQTKVSRAVHAGTTLASLSLWTVFLYLCKLLFEASTRIRSQTRATRRMTQRFTLAMNASSSSVALFDANWELLSCNEHFMSCSLPEDEHDMKALKGQTPQQIMLRAVRAGFYKGMPSPGLTSSAQVERHFTQLADASDGVQIELADGRHLVEKIAQTPLGDRLLTRVDITEFVMNERRQADHARKLEAFADEIRQRALTDALTNLPNRRKLDQVLHARGPKEHAPLVRIDLDRFKQVNDILGHEAGDFVLKTVADILRKHTRAGDLPARIGGDEFVVVCAPCTTLDDAVQIAERLLADILEPVHFGNKRCVYGASFGIAEPRNTGSDQAALLRDADFALYRAKSKGRGRIEVFSDKMRAAANRDRLLADGFVDALANGEIVPFFQTQHQAATGDLCGVEVLARWRHPREGILAPDAFLPIACQLGMDAELDQVMYSLATNMLKTLDEEGIIIPKISFNVSAARIADPRFVTQVSSVSGIDPNRIVFEILESVSLESMGSSLKFAIDALRDVGYLIEVDDFGSGHASINALLDIQPHALKIDRNLIRPLGENPRATTTVGAIIDMAKSVNVEIVAEGVDSIAKAELLKQMGCDRLQGYLFSAPMSLEDLREFVTGGTQKARQT